MHLEDLIGGRLADQPQAAVGQAGTHRVQQVRLALAGRADRRQVPHVHHVEDDVRLLAFVHQPGQLGFPFAEIAGAGHDLRGRQPADAGVHLVAELLRDPVQHRGLADPHGADQQDGLVVAQRVNGGPDLGIAKGWRAHALCGLDQILPLIENAAVFHGDPVWRPVRLAGLLKARAGRGLFRSNKG